MSLLGNVMFCKITVLNVGQYSVGFLDPTYSGGGGGEGETHTPGPSPPPLCGLLPLQVRSKNPAEYSPVFGTVLLQKITVPSEGHWV